jgi:hypothetical protein
MHLAISSKLAVVAFERSEPLLMKSLLTDCANVVSPKKKQYLLILICLGLRGNGCSVPTYPLAR